MRAYIPKDGNTWNHKTKTAFGSGDDLFDEQECVRRWGIDFRDDCYEQIKVDCKLILDDIRKRIIYKG